MDTTTLTGKMIFTVLGGVAELERSLIAERVRAGIRNARAKGKRIGRPAANPALISELKALLAKGKSLRQVGTMLGISVATVHKYSGGCA